MKKGEELALRYFLAPFAGAVDLAFGDRAFAAFYAEEFAALNHGDNISYNERHLERSLEAWHRKDD